MKPGDTIPDVPLLEGAPDKKVSLANELSSGKGLIVAVPAAFSTMISVPLPANPTHLHLTTSIGPGCTKMHIPEYINSAKLKDAGKVFVYSVNDPFVYAFPHTQLLQGPYPLFYIGKLTPIVALVPGRKSLIPRERAAYASWPTRMPASPKPLTPSSKCPWLSEIPDPKGWR